MVLNKLYKHTQLQVGFGVIMLALVDGVPRVLSLKEMLHYYIAHQEDVIVRRTRYELAKAEERAHILEGYVIALDNIDEVIQHHPLLANGQGGGGSTDRALRPDRQADRPPSWRCACAA